MSNTETDGISPDLLTLFPEAKLTMRDRLPTALILTNRIMQLGKAIDNIKYSAEELREAMLGFVAMIPDELRDDQFFEELNNAMRIITIDIRPIFCEQKASVEYCQKKGIPITKDVETFDYLAVYHTCFNLLMRKSMLLKLEEKTFGDSATTVLEEDASGKEETESD